MRVDPVTRIVGHMAVPGDKSISHRSLLFGALAEGETRVTGILEAEDVRSTRRAVEAMGATVREEGAELVVTPPETLREPPDVIDCGNSGTSLRLLAGVLSGVPGLSVLTGDASLRKRPMKRVIDPLRRMGATLSARDGDRLPPLVVKGGPLRGQRFVQEVASAQVKSALLLAGLRAEGETTVVEPERSRDHTERMLLGMGVPVKVDGLAVSVGPSRLRGTRVDVPGDISSAAFFLCAAAGLPGSQVTVRNCGLNPSRTGVLDVLEAMGARLVVTQRTDDGEPRGEARVHAGRLDVTPGVRTDPDVRPGGRDHQRSNAGQRPRLTQDAPVAADVPERASDLLPPEAGPGVGDVAKAGGVELPRLLEHRARADEVPVLVDRRGRPVRGEEIRLQGIVAPSLEAEGLGIELEETMDGLGFPSSRFGKPLGRSTRGRGQQNPQLLGFQYLDERSQ